MLLDRLRDFRVRILRFAAEIFVLMTTELKNRIREKRLMEYVEMV
jgi:hypothetical protein